MFFSEKMLVFAQKILTPSVACNWICFGCKSTFRMEMDRIRRSYMGLRHINCQLLRSARDVRTSIAEEESDTATKGNRESSPIPSTRAHEVIS